MKVIVKMYVKTQKVYMMKCIGIHMDGEYFSKFTFIVPKEDRAIAFVQQA